MHESTSADWYERDANALAGVERLRFFPLVIERAAGVRLLEPGGRELLDFSASWTAAGFGHANRDVTSAIVAALEDAPGASVLSATHPRAIELAERLCALVPGDPSGRRAYLGHAGTDANDVALRGCRRATGRRGVLAFRGGYHGGLGLAQGVSGVHVEAGSPADPDLVLLPYPDAYRAGATTRATREALRDATLDAIRDHLDRRTFAAVIIEPIQSDGGLVVPPEGFLAGVEAACRATGTLLVVDEVKVGLGRTGRTHAFEHDGVAPDVVTFGKALGGGLPLSAAVGPAAVLDEPAASALMTTTGNPVSCAAGLAVLDLLADGVVAANAGEQGERLRAALAVYAASDRPGARLVGDVRGRGLSTGVELVTDRDSRAPAAELTAMTCFRAWQLGLVAYPVRDNVIELTPPLTIGRDELAAGVALLTQAIDDAANGAVSAAEIAPFSGW